MTTVPGSSSGINPFSTYAAKAGPSIAPLITHGAIKASAARPAIKGKGRHGLDPVDQVSPERAAPRGGAP